MGEGGGDAWASCPNSAVTISADVNPKSKSRQKGGFSAFHDRMRVKSRDEATHCYFLRLLVIDAEPRQLLSRKQHLDRCHLVRHIRGLNGRVSQNVTTALSA